MLSYKFTTSTDDKLRLRLINNRKKAELALGIKLNEAQLEAILSHKSSIQTINQQKFVFQCITRLEELKIRLLDEGRPDEDVHVIKDMVRESLGLAQPSDTTPQRAKDDIHNFQSFFLKIGQSKAPGTFESFKYTESTMRKFAPDLDSLTFEDITYAWLSDFEAFQKSRGLSQNTRKIHFGNIRIAMREAYKREMTENDPFRRFTFRPEKTRKRSLPIDELRALFDYPVEEYAVLYRDMFKLIFMLCGINTVDLFNLTAITRNGRIEYRRAKTGRLYSIKVEPEALELIEKYRGKKHLLCLSERWSSHRNFRHQLNLALRRIGIAQGKGRKDRPDQAMWPMLTSYWARHSWASIARAVGVPKDDISLALGHGDGNPVTSIYIDEDLKVIDRANRKVLDWVLYGKR